MSDFLKLTPFSSTPLMIGYEASGFFFLDVSDPKTPVYILDHDGTYQVAFETWREFLMFMSAESGEMPDSLSPEKEQEIEALLREIEGTYA